MSKWNFAMIVAGSVVIALIPVGAAEPQVTGLPKLKLELAAVVDVKAVEQEFDSTSAITLPVRGQMLTFDLAEHDLFGERGREVYDISDTGVATLVGFVTARPLSGSVRGIEPSRVVVTIDSGTSSIFGTVYMNDRAYSLVGEPDKSGKTVLRTIWDENTRPTDIPTPPESIGILAIRDTYVRVFSDTNFRNYASNWQTRITNAFNEQHSMWDSYTEIHQYHGPFTSITGAWSGNCSTHLASFSSAVQTGINSGTYTGSDAFELFTGVDLDAYGCAYTATPGNTLTLGTSSAVAILEAVDQSCCDTYDPDESQNLGIVSATELGHVYGEEDHPQDERCESWFWWGGCADNHWNVMAGGQDIDERSFWFTSGSSTKSADRIKAEAWSQL